VPAFDSVYALTTLNCLLMSGRQPPAAVVGEAPEKHQPAAAGVEKTASFSRRRRSAINCVAATVMRSEGAAQAANKHRRGQHKADGDQPLQ
jgi:hypothetical protein